jgi:hypothetical protein
LGLPRASLYYEPVGERAENLLLMRLFQPVSQLAVCRAARHLTGCGSSISFSFEVETPQDRAPAVARVVSHLEN